MKDLKDKVLRGGLSKLLAQVINFSLRLGCLMILARLLEPKDFGLVAMVTVVTGVFGLFKDAGLSVATVQRATISNEQMSTLFWVNVLVGLVLAVILVNLAPAIARFYHEPRLIWVTTALAADFIFTGAAAQHSALLQRQMRFGAIAVIDTIALLAGISIAVVLAVNGWGYWALVGQIVTMPCISAIATWILAGWLPGLPSSKAKIGAMVHMGGIATLNGLVVHVAYNLEKLLLGRFFGAEALGIYGRAYQLVNIPSENLNGAVAGVAFSALSRIQDDPPRQKRYFLKGYTLMVALTLPITLACAVFADDMIFVFLGAKWQDTVPIFRLLAPTILIFALINPFGWFLYAIGMARRSLQIAFVIAPLVVVAYCIGLPYGTHGVALAYSSAMALWVVPHIAWCIHGTGISARDIVQAVTRPFISGIVAAVLAVAVQHPFNAGLSPLLRLGLGGGAMVIFYLWLLMYVMGQKAFYMDIFQGMKGQSSSKKKGAAAI